MISIRIDGAKEIINGLQSMAKNTDKSLSFGLDDAAKEVKEKMSNEAPKGLSRRLSDEIDIESAGSLIRIIEPVATNFAPGTQYASNIEDGSNKGYIPNVYSISEYYGVDMKMAWAIALSTKERGTPANPFVERTYEWALDQSNKWTNEIGDKLLVYFNQR